MIELLMDDFSYERDAQENRRRPTMHLPQLLQRDHHVAMDR